MWISRGKAETGPSGRKYQNITLTCERGWIRCRCVRPQVNNYITRCHRRLELVGVRVAVPVGDKMPEWEPAPNRELGPSGPTVEQPSRMKKKCCYGQRNLGSICGSLSPSPTHLSHITNYNPFATLSRIKCEGYVFIKKCVRLFIEPRHYVSAYICMYMSIQHLSLFPFSYIFNLLSRGYQSSLFDRFSLFFLNYHLVWSSSRELLICLYLKIPENFVCFILQVRFLFVQMPFASFILLHTSQWITFPTQSCLFLYSLCTSLLSSYLFSLFRGISTFMLYSMPNPSLWKNSSTTIYLIAGW